MSHTAAQNNPQEDAARRFLAQLREEILRHPGVGHSLLGRMSQDPRSRFDFKILASQHFALVGNFTRYMELLLLNAPDSESKSWLAKVLVDEYGERSDGQDHAQLYTHFMHAAGISPGTELDQPLHPEVVGFIREHFRICTQEPFLVGLGALGPGHEWAIPTMFTHAVAGLRKAGFKEEEILYWTCHQEQDKDHGAWLEEALAHMCINDQAREQVRKGALLSLDARERFWWGVLDKITTEKTKATMPFAKPSTAGSEASQPTLRELRTKWKVVAELRES